MKHILMVLFLGGFLSVACTGTVSAESSGQKGANQQAYEHASEHSIFNRVGDWFATIGKSQSEKKEILQERKAERALIQAERELKQKKNKKNKAGKKIKDKTCSE